MSAVKALIDAGIAGQSVALLGENYKVASRSFSSGGKNIKARHGANLKSLVKLGITNVVGISLLRSQAQLAEGL